MPHPGSLLAYLPDYPTVGESLMFQLNGLIVVMLALCSIWGVLEVIGLYFKRADRRVADAKRVAQLAAIPAEPAKAGQTLGAAGVSPQTVAAIAAAVHAVLGAPHRIHHVKPADAPVDWAREGRRQIFASHKLR